MSAREDGAPAIAVVGRAVILPGIGSPADLWDTAVRGLDQLGPVPEGRWRLGPEHAVGQGPDRTWCDRGGYVRGFEDVFAHALAAAPYHLPSEKLIGLDPVFQLALHVAREALRDAGRDPSQAGSGARVGAIFGNLSYPSANMARFAESVWSGGPRPDPLDRFMSGMPAHLLALGLGLGGPAFALDAACASSLYAIKLACDALIDGRADLMLAGAVNRADDLFIHTGFCALSAMSRTGRSRPFHAEADGLVPAEGAGFLALKRLEDVGPEDRVHGVIRAVGLSNDGRGKGFLAPAVEGQVRAMRGAWQRAGLDPSTCSLLECHATGTSVGDATELASMAEVFGSTSVPIGSLKSNLGHLITAAGVAGVVKVMEAMAHGLRPPTLHVDRPNPALADGPFRLLTAPEPWVTDGPRRAGVNAFGFGGNNAHLILDEPGAVRAPRARPVQPVPLAVVALGARVAGGESAAELAEDLRTGRSRIGPAGGRAEPFTLSLRGLRFPPKDLEQSRAQQNLLLAAAREAVDSGPALPRERTLVLVGMGADPEVCRYGARWRLANHLAGEALDAARDAVIPALQAAGVVGNMPNIPANRLNSQFDLAGPSFTVSAEELSGGTALDVAARALWAHEADAAVVGAVDLSCEPVHVEALAALGVHRPPGDAAVTLVLERLDDARRAGHPVLAVLGDGPVDRRFGEGGEELGARFEFAHAATGLVNLAGAVLSGASADVLTRSLTGFTHHLRVQPGDDVLPPRPTILPPTLALPAHPDPVPRLPADPSPAAPRPGPSPAARPAAPPSHEAPVSIPSSQTMAPAPALPPTTAVDPAASQPAASAPAAASPQAPRPSGPVAGPGGALIAAQQHLAAVHTHYLQQQHALHAQFLHTREVALAALRGARAGQAWTGTTPHPVAAPVASPAPVVLPAPVRAPVASPAPVAAPVALPAPAAAPVASPAPAAAPPAPASPAPGARARPDDGSFTLPGPRFSRADLEHLASHRISERLGPLFAIQDAFPRQVRMPEPPFLLADRVTGIDAEPGSMTTGTIWTETDITADAWYVHQGHIPAGVMIEAGQADLLLISWLGADFQNRGERVYRLLGCELTYHGGLPRVGDTLKYDIHVDGHAQHGAVRLFFFHSDCRVDGQIRLSVRQGQAGFFTDAELEHSGGILWTAETGEHAADARVDPPAVALARSAFSREQIDAFAHGDALACFGPGFELARTHTRTPRIAHGDMTLLHRVDALDPQGGPWGRGYLKATQDLADDDWFFQGHFKDDPCMPGTLMFDGCLQALAFYMTGLGFTLKRDGWRFEPVPGVPYALKCRGQAIPGDRVLTYEVFVEEVHDGPIPTVYADLLVTVDGLGAFHARRVGLQLVPGWPLDEGHPDLAGKAAPTAVARMEDGFPFDQRSLYACAWGRPSEAFGAPYAVFDHVKKVARLPGPPYLFISRVTSTSAPFGGFKPGVEISVEYDVPPEAWYFWENAYPTMPFAVLLEAALQPCGWLASYVGSALTTEQELFFRNLDGTGTLLVEVLPRSGTLRTDVKITGISASGGMIIESFEVVCWIGDTRVYEMKTVFGFFPEVALANQLGIPPTPAEREAVKARSADVIDLRARPARYFDGPLRLPEPMLLMCDRITGWWPEGGAKGLGRVCGEKDVNPSEWFFASHFFQDPVQPGSLGLENLVQVLQWVAIERGLADGMDDPHFEPLMLGRPMTWKYRGQVVPKNKVIRTELDIVEQGEDERGRFLVADGWLWADELRIYQAVQMGIRVVDGPPAGPRPAQTDRDVGRSYVPVRGSGRALPAGPVAAAEVLLDPAVDTWLGDHRPTWTVPALPAMSMIDRLLAGRPLPAALADVRVRRWLTLDGPVRTRVVTEGDLALLEAWRAADDPRLSRFERVCEGRFVEPGERPAPWPALDGPVLPDPYAAGTLFHGPAFQLLTRLVRTAEGASAELDADAGAVPRGATHQALLDALTHAIPHDQMSAWYPELEDDAVAYPQRLRTFRVWGPAPTGRVRAEIRPLPREDRSLSCAFQIIADGQVWADGELTEIRLPKGPLGRAAPEDRRAFLRDRAFVAGLGLSTLDAGGGASLGEPVVRKSDWLSGTVDQAYGLPPLPVTERLQAIAIKDAIGQAAGVHPTAVDAGSRALRTDPLTRWPLAVEGDAHEARARLEGLPAFELAPVRAWWDRWFGVGRWPVEDIFYGLIERFVGAVRVPDPDAFEAVRGRSLLYLANHQVAVESLLFSVLASALTGVPTVTLAKAEHRHTWVGRLIAHSFAWPGVRDPEVITFFDREDKQSLPRIIGELAAQMRGPGRSVLVHVEGTRSLECRTPVQKMSSAFIDMALQTGAPIVPVRFASALPTEAAPHRLEFPLGLGKQEIWLGTPLLPEDLARVPYKERKELVLAAINGLGPDHADERPTGPDPALREAADAWKRAHPATDDDHAVIAAVLAALPDPHPVTQAVLAGAPDSPWAEELHRRLTRGL